VLLLRIWERAATAYSAWMPSGEGTPRRGRFVESSYRRGILLPTTSLNQGNVYLRLSGSRTLYKLKVKWPCSSYPGREPCMSLKLIGSHVRPLPHAVRPYPVPPLAFLFFPTYHTPACWPCRQVISSTYRSRGFISRDRPQSIIHNPTHSRTLSRDTPHDRAPKYSTEHGPLVSKYWKSLPCNAV
jgi:hypothetical protein